MNIFGLGLTAMGYAIWYWATNILVQSYKRQGAGMNPPPLAVCLGVPGANAAQTNPLPPATPMSGGPSPQTPGTTQQPGAAQGTDPNSIQFTPSPNGTTFWPGE